MKYINIFSLVLCLFILFNSRIESSQPSLQEADEKEKVTRDTWMALQKLVRNVKMGTGPFLTMRMQLDQDYYSSISRYLENLKCNDLTRIIEKNPKDTMKDINLRKTRFGDLTREEAEQMKRIVNDESMAGQFVLQQLSAHGIEKSKGGLGTLFNILIEGELHSRWTGPLIKSDPSISAGNHGPFFIIVKSNPKESDTKDGRLQSSAFLAYLVPSEWHRKKLLNFLEVALDKKLITQEEVDEINKKIITYSEFIEMSEEYPTKDKVAFGAKSKDGIPLHMIDDKLFSKAVKRNFIINRSLKRLIDLGKSYGKSSKDNCDSK